MASLLRALPVATLILRVLTLIFLAASLAVIAAARIYAPGADVVDPPNFTFLDIYAYRYVLSVGVIGCAYTLLVIPLVAINVGRREMVGGNEGGTKFLIFADVVFSVLIATGAAAGLGLTVDVFRQLHAEGSLRSDVERFLHSVDASCGVLLVAAVCMVVIVMISVYSLTK